MDENVSPTIPSSMRPSRSLLAHVKSTLSDLVSSVFKTPIRGKKLINDKGDTNEPVEKTDETSELCEVSLDGSPTSKNGNETLNSSTLSKSQLIRTKEAYRKRLKSFKLSLWCGKPLSLSPPLLAQYGWECVGENIAKCCICGALIAIHLPWPNSSNYHVVCKEAQQKIIKGHKKICSWPTNPISDANLNPFHEEYLSLEDKERLKEDFVEKAQRMQELKQDLPHLTLDILNEMELDEDSIGRMIHMCGFHEQELSTSVEEKIALHAMHTSAVALALCGWDKEANIKLPGLYCDDTGRTVGLWNFYSVAPDEEQSSPYSTKRRKLDSGTASSLIVEKGWFHPLSQHHVWSPWIVSLNSISALLNDSSVGAIKDDVKPGWKVLRDLLLANSTSPVNGDSFSATPSPKSSKTPPRIAVLQTRRMLDDWASP